MKTIFKFIFPIFLISVFFFLQNRKEMEKTSKNLNEKQQLQLFILNQPELFN